MSIKKKKKQAKNLRRLLPEFQAQHPDGAKLSDYQELIARTHGYPSFHAMSDAFKRASANAPESPSLGSLTLRYLGVQDWPIYDDEGNHKEYQTLPYATLAVPYARYSPEDSLSAVTSEFDDARESEGGMSGSFEDYSRATLQKLSRLATKLTMREPAFIDGHAFRTGAHVHLKQYREASDLATSYVAGIFELIEQCALANRTQGLLVPYAILENRPFHRLAHSLVLARIGLGEIGSAVALAKQMYALWPNDNMGFRFLVDDPSLEDC